MGPGPRGLGENSRRRSLAFLALDQSARILNGLEGRTAEGIAAAVVHWFVVKMLAALAPALRAATIDPARSLRDE